MLLLWLLRYALLLAPVLLLLHSTAAAVAQPLLLPAAAVDGCSKLQAAGGHC
jgi:hypothetical protein